MTDNGWRILNQIQMAESYAISGFLIVLLCAAVVIGVLTIVGVFMLKNRLGVYLGWIPSFITLLFGIMTAVNHDYVLISIFVVYFLSYAAAVIIKLVRDNGKRKTTDSLKKEFDRMNIDDLD